MSLAAPAHTVQYERRRPEETIVHRLVREHLETFLAQLEAGGTGLPRFVNDEFDAFLECGILAPGFLRLRGGGCGHEKLSRPTASACTPQCASARGAPAHPARMSWALLLKRVFDIDIERCPNCGGRLKIIAAIEEPAVIGRILTHMVLSCTPIPGLGK